MKIINLNQFKDKKVAILWFWLEGKSSLKFLEKIWVSDITILDKNDIENKKENIKYITWDSYLESLDTFDIIIKAPWISPYQNNLLWLLDKITTQTEIFTSLYSWKIIWITGTKWKSTTSTITYLALKNAWYKVKLVWNIWAPVLDEIDIINGEKYDYIVYEMSSYMLEWLKPKLYIWLVNNIYDCHLDWHNWIKNYTYSKLNILEKSKHKIANIEIKNIIKDIDWVEFFWEGTNYLYKEKYFFIDWVSVLQDQWFLINWEHNRLNIVWILAILKQIKKDKFCSIWILSRLINWLKQALENFKWLPHRLEEVWVYNDILFIDDGIATTPESTIAAINTYEQKIWTLFLWWYDYWFDFKNLVEVVIKNKIENIVLFPDSWEKIFWDISQYQYENEFTLNIKWLNINFIKTRSMESAVKFAYKNTKPWMICLLSNASASYGLWSWFIEKWTQFQKYIKQYWNKTI